MPALRAGFVAGRYRLDHLLSRGGMGQVWAARHLVTNHRVAVKVLAHSPLLEPQARRRFLREARTAAAVSHPNVVKVQDFFELEDGTPAMVMELLDGETLARRLDREKTLSLEHAAEILVPVVGAVGYAHSLGIVHRDLKPDNVFLVRRPEGGFEPCVLDFGIAKLMTAGIDEVHGTGVLTGTGTMLGTPSYMSPEQTLCESVIDHRADIWAIGVILYEALAGVRPFDWSNVGQLVRHFMTHQLTAIEELRPDVPPDVAELVGRMLARARDARPDDLREVYAVLTRFTDVRGGDFGPPLQTPHTPTLQSQIEPAAEPTLETAMDVALADESDQLPVLHRTPRSGSAGPQSLSIQPERRRTGRRLAVSGAIAGLTIAGSVYFLTQGQGASARIQQAASPPVGVVTTRAATPTTPMVEPVPAAAPEPSAAATTPAPVKKSAHPGRRATTPVPAPAPSTTSPARDGLIDENPF